MATWRRGAASRRGAWLLANCLLALALGGAGLGRAEAQLFTAHLTTDAAAVALAKANGGAIRFTTEAQLDEQGVPALSVRLMPFGDGGGGGGEGGKDGGGEHSPKWPNGVPVPFSVSYDGQGTVTLAVTVQGKTLTARNGRDLSIVGDFTDLFVRTRVKGGGTAVTVADLVVDGLLVGDGAAASDPAAGGRAPLDVLRVAGTRLSAGFQLSGHITASWQGTRPKDARLSIMIWGAKILGALPSDAPPLVSIARPAPGSFVAGPQPVIAGTFLGADPATVRLLVDGVERTTQAQLGPGTIVFTPPAPLADGGHQALVFARKPSGVSGQAATSFIVDTSPPQLTITAPGAAVIQDNPAPAIAVTYADAGSGFDTASLAVDVDGALLTSRCQVGAAAASCQPPPLAAGDHLLTVRGRDRAGNQAMQTFAFKLVYDTTPPSLTITAPAQPLIVGTPSPAIGLSYADAESGVDLASLRVLLDQQDVTASCTVGPAAAQCQPPPLRHGPHAVAAQISDRRGNLASASAAFDLALPVAIAFTAPQPEQVTAVAAVKVTGTVAATATSVVVNGVAATLSAGAFAIDSLGLHEGINNLVAVAQDAQGNVGTAALRVIVDTTPPRVSFSYPRDGAVVSSASLVVTGLVNDLTVGTVNQTQASVTVNGVAAKVAHRSFVASGVPLVPGSNQLVAVATDRAGNHAMATVHVTLAPASSGPTLHAVSGDAQSGTVSAALAAPLVVAVADAAGAPLANAPVVFRVVQGNGTLQGGGRSALVRTDAQGRAAAAWTLGSRAGVAVNRVRATAPGAQGEATFFAQAAPGPPAAIFVASGDDQNGAVGTALAQAFFAVVFDGGDNPVPGVPVTFQITRGGGGLGGGPSQTVATDDSGLATARLTLGALAGLDGNLVAASFPGLAGRPATFKASAFELGDPAQTRVAGLVLDNQGLPVPGVTIRLRDSSLTTSTDAGGQFRLAGVPVGQLFLIADATTAARPGSWASLEYELFALAGIENHLPRPIYILPLALQAGAFVDETHGGSVQIPGIPGFALDIAPGSVTFPGGGRSGTVSVTAVHGDKIPMPPGAGMQPRLIVTIQPAGARFEPPARLTLPNVDGRPPGSVTEMFSFEHAIGAFVSVGTGTVSEDGLVLQSDPGFGVVEAGWHCGAPSTSNGDTEQVHVDVTTDVQLLANAPRRSGAQRAAIAPRAKVLPKAAFLCADQTSPPDNVELTATGGPSVGATYTWELQPGGGQPVINLDSLGEGFCADQDTCKNKATATGGTGTDAVKVTIVDQLHPDVTASDTASVTAIRLLGLTADPATDVGACLVTTFPPPHGEVEFLARVDPPTPGHTLPPGFITWTGGQPLPPPQDTNPIARIVHADGQGFFQVTATCGGPPQQASLYVVADDHPPAGATADIHPVQGPGQADPGTADGVALYAIGQGGVTAPSFEIYTTLDGDTWKFQLKRIVHTYFTGFLDNHTHVDIPGPGSSFVTTQQLCRIVSDLTPGPDPAAGPPQTLYFSDSLVHAYVSCRVNRFYTRFWQPAMTKLQGEVDGDEVPFTCDDLNSHFFPFVAAQELKTRTQDLVDLHNQAVADDAANGAAECRGTTNPQYLALIGALKKAVPPLDPTGLAGAAAHGRISLAWASSACNETGFRVERRAAGAAAFSPVGPVGACAAPPCNPSFVDTQVTARTTYSYRVVATGVAGDSNPSNVVTVTAVP